MNHKRKGPKNKRAGCIYCKVHKHQAHKDQFGSQTHQEQRALLKDAEIETDLDSQIGLEDEVEHEVREATHFRMPTEDLTLQLDSVDAAFARVHAAIEGRSPFSPEQTLEWLLEEFQEYNDTVRETIERIELPRAERPLKAALFAHKLKVVA
jgi:hypothetical protein